MRRPPTILSKDEVIKICDEKHTFIINGIYCSIRLYLHSSNYFSILHDCYTYKYSDVRKSYMTLMDSEKLKLLRQHFNNCDEVEIIERSTNKKGVYKISLQCTRDGDIKFLYGHDILEYNHHIESHKKYLDENRALYQKINFDNYILLIDKNSERSSHPLERNVSDKDYKEFLILDNNYFEYIIKNLHSKRFGIIREMVGVSFIHIYHKCEIVSYDNESKKILFNFYRSNDEIRIHKELNINPIQEFKAYKRKQKILCLLK